MMSGRKSMPQVLHKTELLEKSVLATLGFFALYDLPMTARRIHELLLDYQASLAEVEKLLEILAADNKIYKAGNLYSFKPWKANDIRNQQIEISKKWNKIDRFYNWIAILPFVRMVSVINSLSMGTADSDSDIDFFVVTEKKKLYFVRSMIIVVFRILGVYKTRQNIKDRFCFGFFITRDNLDLNHLRLKPSDPYFLFWMVNMRPLIGGQQYWEFMQANNWLNQHFSNFELTNRLTTVKNSNIFIKAIKFLLETLLWLPAVISEPILRKIHIDHTFKLAENHAVTSTTIANAKMLKLHAADVRSKIARAHNDLLQSLR